MNKLSQAVLGALIGATAGTAMGLASIPTTNWLLRSPGWNDAFYNFPLWFAIAGLHGVICGAVMGLLNQKTMRGNIVLGGIVGLTVAMAFLFAFAAALTVKVALDLWQNPLPNSIPSPTSMIVSTPFIGLLGGMFFFVKLAVPSIVHGIVIGLLNKGIVKRSSLGARYK
jgi:hypothetical protein